MQLVKVKDDLYIPENFGANHYYYADPEGKKKYTGISSIIGVLAKPALIGWAARMATEHLQGHFDLAGRALNEWTAEEWKEICEEAKKAHTKKKEAAGAHGTDTHALVEEYVNLTMQEKHEHPRVYPQDSPIYRFTLWAAENVDHFLFSERRMANSELFIAGTADFAYIGKDGRRYMADFKTSSGVYGIDYWLQVAAYRLLAEGEGDEPYDGATIVRLGKDGSFEVQQLYDYETYKEAFLACLTLYRAQSAIAGTVVKS